MLRKLIKYIASYSPFPLTQNEKYDRLTEQIIRKVCNKDSVCVDVGANEGKILSMFIKHCHDAVHYAFEPLPDLYFKLVRKYGSAANIYKTAMSDQKGIATFNYVTDDAAYSSLKLNDNEKRPVTTLNVETDLPDNIIPENININLIKLDIEGGEYNALLGSKKLISRCKPYIIFEFGKGGSDVFIITPQMMFDFFSSAGYSISTLDAFLNAAPVLNFSGFQAEYDKGKEYMFIGCPVLA